MPYKTNADLPASVSDHLPEHAQTIFREALDLFRYCVNLGSPVAQLLAMVVGFRRALFNNAHQKYPTEAQAFKVAVRCC